MGLVHHERREPGRLLDRPFEVVGDPGRGSEALHRSKLPALLTSLADRARVASIEASSAIEGVVVDNKARAADILAGSSDRLRDRSEQELAGYRGALDYLYQEQWRPLNSGLVLHLHRLLFGASTERWHDAEHDPWPWLRYFVGLVAGSYGEFAALTSAARRGVAKQERVREDVLQHAPGTFQIADVRAAVPGVSDQTIRIVLNRLKSEGLVAADAVGRGATWTQRD